MTSSTTTPLPSDSCLGLPTLRLPMPSTALARGRPFAATCEHVPLRDHARAILAAIYGSCGSMPAAGGRSRLQNAALTMVLHLGDQTGLPSRRRSLAKAFDALGQVVAHLLIGVDAGLIATGDAEALIAQADRLGVRIIEDSERITTDARGERTQCHP